MKPRQYDNFVLTADEVRSDRDNDATIAIGQVEIVSEPYTLMADQVVYYKQQNIMIARGNVQLLQDTGEVVFSDYMEFSGDASHGTIINFRILFADNSRLMARKLVRTPDGKGGEKTQLENVVYSPCNLCASDPRRAPIWQIRARDALHSSTDKEIIYHDAKLDLFGVPVFYTPYISYPDPSVKQKAGFLTPSLLTGSDLGTLLRTYYYYPISPNEDATAELGYATNEGPLLGLEWRKRMAKSEIKFWGAVADSEPQTASAKDDSRIRGFINGTGLYDINNRWRSGFNLAYAGDTTFLRQYKYSTEDILRNRLYAERFVGRSYSGINAYAFQDLRPGRPGDQPNLLPLASYSDYGNPGATFGGRWSLNGSLLGVARPQGGQQMERLSTTAGWQRRFIGDSGLKTTVDAQFRADGYYVQNADPALAGPARDGDVYSIFRAFPAMNVETSYPFVKQGHYLQYTIEPVASLTATPHLKNAGIPNEDSQDIELDPTNLFKISRYTGLDRVEDGIHTTYGLRTGYNNPAGGYANFFFGQSYRLDGNPIFPAGSGLDTDSSDYVAQIIAAPSQYLNGDYRVRFNHDDFSPERHELNFSAGSDRLRLSTNYAYLKRVENTNLAAVREQIVNSISTKLTKEWTVRISDTHNLGDNTKPLVTTLGIEYLDECFGILLSAQRDYTQREGIDSGDTIYLQLSFKNLGAVTSPTISPDFISGNRTSTP